MAQVRCDHDSADSDRATDLQRRAIAAAECGKHDLAVADFTAALLIHIDRVARSVDAALGSLEHGEADGAAAEMVLAATCRSFMAEAYFQRGFSHAAMADYDRAISDFDQSLLIGPARGVVYLHRGAAHHFCGHTAQSNEDFATAVRLDPGLVAGHFYSAHSNSRRDGNRPIVAEDLPAIRFSTGDAAPGIARVGVTPAQSLRPTEIPGLSWPRAGFLNCADAKEANADDSGSEGIKTEIVSAIVPIDEVDSSTTNFLELPDDAARVTLEARLTIERPSHRDLAVKPDESHSAVHLPPADVTLRQAGTARAQPEADWTALYHCPICPDAPAVCWVRERKALHCMFCNGWFRRTDGDAIMQIAPPMARDIKRSRKKSGERVVQPNRAPRPPRRWSATFGRLHIPLPPVRWAACGAGAFAAMLAVLTTVHHFSSGGLQRRGEIVARAWLAQDKDRLLAIVEPTAGQYVAEWLATNPPPAYVATTKHSPTVTGAVHSNDGKTAEVWVQIELKDNNDVNHTFASCQQWRAEAGTWYFSPTLDRSAKIEPKVPRQK